MNGCFNSVTVEYRSLYESFVIGQYLVQNPDLVPVYKDHLQFLRYHIESVERLKKLDKTFLSLQ